MYAHVVDQAIEDLQKRVRALEEKNGIQSPASEIGPEEVVVPAPIKTTTTAEYEARIEALENLVKTLGASSGSQVTY